MQARVTRAKVGLILLGWLVMFSVGNSDSARTVFAQERVPVSDALESARARWSALPAEERERMRKRFERVQEMDSTQRKELEQRTAHLLKLQKRVIDQLSDADRKRLMGQPVARRRELIAELVEQERRSDGQRIESKLPSRIRKWLREATPEQRRSRLREFKKEVRERISALAVEDLAKALGFTGAERKRLERLPLPKRVKTVLALRKQLTAQQIADGGLPADLSIERWKEIESMPPEKFVAEVMRLQNRGMLGDTRKIGSLASKLRAPKAQKIMRSFRKAMNVTASDRLRLSELPLPQKRSRLNRLRRHQVADMLRQNSVAEQGELKRMERLDDEAFIQHARDLSESMARTERANKPR